MTFSGCEQEASRQRTERAKWEAEKAKAYAELGEKVLVIQETD